MSQSEQREEAVFEAAMALPANERAAYLDQACAGDAGLRRRVAALLAAFERAGGFMKAPAVSLSPSGREGKGEEAFRRSSFPPEKPGDRIGRYKLLEQIGEGGCGVVYVAEQEEPVRRRVALKVIKLGMDTKQVIARFDAERQALAMMDHPNIAKIHDAGVTESPLPASGHPLPAGEGEGQGKGAAAKSEIRSGRPYFVMELVRGIKITDYCEQNHLSPRERLDLFIQVCRAIQHAHQKGVIHRDIKPSNILVTLHDGVPVPKVIDFGIAKATQGRLTDQTVYTAFEQFIGTPAYMSPEQAEMSGLDIDTRSDIYSLGVLLYELLTGTTPFDAKELLAKGLDEMRRTIREVEPVKPSTRLTLEIERTHARKLPRPARNERGEGGGRGAPDATSESQTSTSSPRPSPPSNGGEGGDSPQRQRSKSAIRRDQSTIPSDLDWIVMKCLEKDRARRYETANGLATDIARHVSNEPIVARPPSNLYRFQKTVQRNKLAFGAATAVALALVIGFAVSTAMYLRAQAEKKKAQTEAARSGQVAKFLTEMLKAAGPSVARGRDATILREILEKTSERVGKEIKDQPEVQGDIWLTLGGAYEDIRDRARAINMFQNAVASYRLAFPGDHKNLALALGKLGRCQSFNQDVTNGHLNAGLGLEMARRCGDKEVLIHCLFNFAASFTSWGGGSTEGIPYLQEALELRKQEGTNPVAVARLMRALANSLTNDAEAEQLTRAALALHREHLPPDHPEVVEDMFGLGQHLLSGGKYEEAEKTLREVVDLYHRIYDPNEPYQPVVLRFLVESLLVQGEGDEAESLVRQQLAATPTHAGHLDLLRRLLTFRSASAHDGIILTNYKGDFLMWDMYGNGEKNEAPSPAKTLIEGKTNTP